MMKKAAFKWIAAIIIFLQFFSFSVQATTDVVPDPVGDIYIQDFVGLLSSEQKFQLNELGRKLEDATTAQVAVLTVDSLGGLTIEEFSNQAFRKYALGSEENNNGVLLVISTGSQTGDRYVRIEVGYGLEGALPDGKVGRILDEYTIPYLAEGRADEAIIQTYKVLYNEVAAEYNWDGEAVKVTPYAETESSPWSAYIVGIIAVIIIILDMLFFGGTLTRMLLFMLARGGGGRSGPRSGGGGSSGGGGASRNW